MSSSDTLLPFLERSIYATKWLTVFYLPLLASRINAGFLAANKKIFIPLCSSEAGGKNKSNK